jgi:hypothetical protein
LTRVSNSVSWKVRKTMSILFEIGNRGWRQAILSALLVLSVMVQPGVAREQIANGSEPENSLRTMELIEEWRVGGDDDEIFFGVISDVLIEGELIYLLDQQLNQVFVYSLAGEYLRTIGREGEGPGEVRQPRGIFPLPDGGIGIYHQPMGNFSCLDGAGEPAESIFLRDSTGERLASIYVQEVDLRGGRMLIAGEIFSFPESGQRQDLILSYFDLSGGEVTRLFEQEKRDFNFQQQTYNESLSYRKPATLGPDGTVYIAPERDSYLIEQRNPDGELLRTIQRQFKAPRRTAVEKEEVGGGASMTINGKVVKLKTEVDAFPPCIANLFVDDTGQIWVTHARSEKDLPEGVVLRQDLFNPEGKFIESVDMVCAEGLDGNRLYPIDGERFIMVRGLADAFRSLYARFNADDETEPEEASPLEVIFYKTVDR